MEMTTFCQNNGQKSIKYENLWWKRIFQCPLLDAQGRPRRTTGNDPFAGLSQKLMNFTFSCVCRGRSADSQWTGQCGRHNRWVRDGHVRKGKFHQDVFGGLVQQIVVTKAWRYVPFSDMCIHYRDNHYVLGEGNIRSVS